MSSAGAYSSYGEEESYGEGASYGEEESYGEEASSEETSAPAPERPEFQATYATVQQTGYGLRRIGGRLGRIAARAATLRDKALEAVDAVLANEFEPLEIPRNFLDSLAKAAAALPDLGVLNPRLVVYALYVHSTVLRAVSVGDLFDRLGRLVSYTGLCSPESRAVVLYGDRPKMAADAARALLNSLAWTPEAGFRTGLQKELRAGMDAADAAALYVFLFVLERKREARIEPVDLFRYLRRLELGAKPRPEPFLAPEPEKEAAPAAPPAPGPLVPEEEKYADLWEQAEAVWNP